MASFIMLGPSGGGGGRPFNDFFDVLGGFSGPGATASILSLAVNAGQTLDHLRVTYRSPGTGALGPFQHGASNGGNPSPPFFINLDAGEKLMLVEGWIHVFDGTLEVGGFKFTTNFRQSGVLGSDSGQHFSLPAPANGEVIAFWGRQGLFFDAVGIIYRTP